MTILTRLWKALLTAARLGCPRCGERTLFRGLFVMHEQCRVCHLRFEREPGYFIGAIYINYAATVVPILTGFLLLDSVVRLPLPTKLFLWGAVGVLLPLLFYRHSKSLWLAIDHLVNPEEGPLRLLGRTGR